MHGMGKSFLRYLMVGGLVGGVAFAWLSPQFIAWYFAPPVELAITCRSAVEWGVGTFRKVLVGGVGVGIVGGALTFVFMARRRQAKAATPVISKP